MVIQASEIEAIQRRTHRDEIKDLERRIDSAIKNARDTPITIDAQHVGSSGPVFKTIAQMYRAAGWSVKFQYDQREGDFLQLTPQKGRRY